MRGKSPEKDNSERYLLTYADLMNLLLILFIVLFAASQSDTAKETAIFKAIRAGFNANPIVTSSVAVAGDSKKGTSKPDPSIVDFVNQLKALLKQYGILDKVDVTSDANEVIISFNNNVLFQPGKADLDSTATRLLSTIGSILTKVNTGQILIEGHTDSDPLLQSSPFKNNLELSSVRADNVEDVFLASGIDFKKLASLGYGEFWPAVPNNNVANKAKNRRVVITIMTKGIAPPHQAVDKTQFIKTLQDAAEGQTESQASSIAAASSKATTSSK